MKNLNRQLTKQEIVNYLLSDKEAYLDDISCLIKDAMSDDDYIYWDAWFRGAEEEDMNKAAELQIVYPLLSQ
jgi:hypothetical protein